MLSIGLWAGTIGTRRLLKLFEKYNIKASWFIPGHSLETFPEECAMVRDAGHEIGLHGYSHENPSDMTFEQQRDVLHKSWKLLTDFCGKPPRGSVTPWWETSEEGTDLLLSYGIEYDHSMSHHDCQAYWLRTGDSWTKIDYTQKAETWMKPLVKGNETGLVEIPGSWYIDDLPPMMFMKKSANSHGWVNPRCVLMERQNTSDRLIRMINIATWRTYGGITSITSIGSMVSTHWAFISYRQMSIRILLASLLNIFRRIHFSYDNPSGCLWTSTRASHA